MKPSIFPLFLLGILAFTFSNCKGGSKISSAVENPAVQEFLTRFNKEKFLEELAKERDRYEGLVKVAKANNVNNPDLISKYNDTQEVFNKVLDDMTADIEGVKTIVGFKIIDNESRYRRSLEDAKIVGGKFSSAINAEKTLEGKLPYGIGIAAFAKMVIFPLIAKVHDRYLKYCQNKMVEKINQTRFRTWDAI